MRLLRLCDGLRCCKEEGPCDAAVINNGERLSFLRFAFGIASCRLAADKKLLETKEDDGL